MSACLPVARALARSSQCSDGAAHQPATAGLAAGSASLRPARHAAGRGRTARQRWLRLIFAGLLVLGHAAWAVDFHAGVQAYEQGDFARALAIWLPLAKAGDAAAQNNVAVIYDHGEGLPEDDVEAVRWYRRAADQDNVLAQYSLGLMYSAGEGVAEDNREAVRWFRRAAKLGHVQAQYHLGLVFDYGHGIAEDDQQALHWYRLAAEQGHAKAQYNLGLMLDSGEGARANAAGAVRWFLRAAEQGTVRAQHRLGLHYLEGRGVPRDLVAAYAWLTLAAAEGHTRAAQVRASTWKRLDGQQRALAVKRHRELRAHVSPGWAAALPAPVARPADSLHLVRDTQAALAERGYTPGPADGALGPLTQQAIRAFQHDIGLAETGLPTRELLTLLRTLDGTTAAGP